MSLLAGPQGVCGELAELFLFNNEIGKAGGLAVARVLQTGALGELMELNMSGNPGMVSSDMTEVTSEVWLGATVEDMPLYAARWAVRKTIAARQRLAMARAFSYGSAKIGGGGGGAGLPDDLSELVLRSLPRVAPDATAMQEVGAEAWLLPKTSATAHLMLMMMPAASWMQREMMVQRLLRGENRE